ncbi:MAG: helix-turn-helix domain-containing protein [Lautropia sp.]
MATTRPIAVAPPGEGTGEAQPLGGHVRSTRMLKGLKLREVALRAGCSESLLSKIENGHVNPSLSMLHRIAAALDVTIPALFAATRQSGIVSASGNRPSVVFDRWGSTLERLVSPADGHLLEGNLHVLAAGGGSEGLLSHEGEEVGFVIDGHLELQVGDETWSLGPGDSFCFRSELPHRYRNPGPGRTRVVWVSTPPSF